jgi:hypothetical protein
LSFIQTQFISYSDEISKIKKKLKGDRDNGVQSSVSKKPKDDENEAEDSEGNESRSEMRRKA